jgi:hypothetical protein
MESEAVLTFVQYVRNLRDTLYHNPLYNRLHFNLLKPSGNFTYHQV